MVRIDAMDHFHLLTQAIVGIIVLGRTWGLCQWLADMGI